MSSIDGGLLRPASTNGMAEGSPLRQAADRLEAAFLSEMLKAARFGEPPQEFGGGVGEDQFASFLRDAQAEKMVEAGGIGLSERLFRSLAGGAQDEP